MIENKYSDELKKYNKHQLFIIFEMRSLIKGVVTGELDRKFDLEDHDVSMKLRHCYLNEYLDLLKTISLSEVKK